LVAENPIQWQQTGLDPLSVGSVFNAQREEVRTISL